MLDTFHLPTDKGGADLQIFNCPSTATNVQWSTWIKPRGKSMLNIFCLGSGAGGGGGFTGIASSARGGGGSGGSGALSRVTIPLFLLPDVLYIQVGAGGQGVGSGGGTAGGGIISYVGIAPNTTASNIIVNSGNVAGGGGTGTVAAVGAAGTAGAVATIASMPLAGLGQFDLIAGQAGVAGGAVAGAVGTAQSIPVTSILASGGTGGAGTTSADFAGGLWTAIAGSWLSEQRPATPAAGSNNGSDGLTFWKPFFSFGGTGGSSSNSGVGGNGGNGGYGSGGGGGGGGTTGGRGGDGGSGLVIMTAW